MTWSTSQKYLAEFLGTFSLLLAVGGAASFTAGLDWDFFARVLLISFAVGFALVGLAYAFGDLSGAHFNPAVTLSMALSRRMPMRDVAPYLVLQVLGAILGMAVIVGILHGSSGAWSSAQHAGFGSQCYADSSTFCGGYPLASVLLIEVAVTFIFVLVIQLVTRPESSAKNLAPAAIGLMLLAGNLIAIPVDGASLNPARSLAPALFSSLTGGPSWPIDQVWVFWLAPIIGGLLAGVAETLLRPKP